MLRLYILSCLAALPSLTVLAVPTLENRAKDRFTLYDLPNPATGPCDLEHGPDNALWGQAILKNEFFRIDPKTGHIDVFPIPFTTALSPKPIQLPGVLKSISDRTALSCAIRTGTDGNLYAGNGLRNQLIRINPYTHKIDFFNAPGGLTGDLFPFNDLYTAKDGMWFTSTTANTFAYFDYKTEKITSYNVPTPAAIPLGLFVGSDGIVYVAELVANKIMTFNPKTKVTNEYPLPEPAQSPAVIRAERDGYIYFSMFVGNGIGRMNMKTHKFDLYHTNQTGLLGSEDTIDSKGGVWLSSFTTDVMSRLDTNTFKYNYVALPKSLAQEGLNGLLGDVPPYVDIAVNYGPGDAIWFTSLLANYVGRYDITGLYDQGSG